MSNALRKPEPVVTATDEAPDVSGREFRRSVLAGLAATPKTLEAKYFYDARGSKLFDAITALEEYYPTRAETALLRHHAGAIADFVGAEASLIEFGSGSSVKTRVLLDALPDLGCYVPIDISGTHLKATAEALARDYPLLIVPVHADYTRDFALPDSVPAEGRVGFFPGSTIGNFDREAAVAFLQGARRLLGNNARFLVGADLQKDEDRLVAAYDDAEGVTAAFNLNLLRRINRELDGTFDLAGFRHEARYDAQMGRIEMHLVSRRPQAATVAGRRFDFAAGETIHTENSYKYTLDSFADMARQGGWRVEAQWRDPEGLFSLHGLVAA